MCPIVCVDPTLKWKLPATIGTGEKERLRTDGLLSGGPAAARGHSAVQHPRVSGPSDSEVSIVGISLSLLVQRSVVLLENHGFIRP